MRPIFMTFVFILFISYVFLANSLLNDIKTNSFYSHITKLAQTKLPLEKFFILDSIGIILGIRKIVSDIAWIQLLQYYGGHPPEDKHCNKHNHIECITKIQPGKYLDFIKYVRRVTILDPLHSFAYFYGVGALAWNLERPDEALEYLKEGLKNLEFQKDNPESDYWQLVKYQQAIYYKLGGKYKEMLNELKEIIQKGKAPNMVKAILANLYKKYGFYKEAILIWEELLDSGDPEYVERAQIQIKELKTLLSKTEKYKKEFK
ncbi:MAG: hypothetical protein RMJ67_04000 [Elusimicrobiota bacterium]|nr:hypothetical protein [Endomicrobiia bacterium]MDW8165654.1 hypothetical protein [Elusimicrobiota bacterium]